MINIKISSGILFFQQQNGYLFQHRLISEQQETEFHFFV